MATRLYFEANTVPAITPAFDGNWASNAQAVRRLLRTTQDATTETRAGALTGAADDEDLIVQLISPPLAGAQTVSGTMTVVSRGRELAGTDNINSRPRHARVVQADGSLRGTLEAYTVPASTTELSTTFAGQQHMTNGAIISVNAQDGDRIVVEIGYRESSTGTTPQWEMVLGGTGTDHGSAANNDTTGTVPWLELSANLVFQTGAVTARPPPRRATVPQFRPGRGAYFGR